MVSCGLTYKWRYPLTHSTETPDNWLAVEKCGENKYCCPSSGSGCCTNGAKIYTLNATNPDASATASSGSDSASTGSSDGQTTTSKASSGGGSVPTAAIAGGVVGGVVLIGFLFFGVCCFRRRRKQSAPAAPDPSPSGMAAGAGGAGGRGSDDKWSPVGHQESLAEAEGGEGKVFTEVDSKPVTGTGLDEKKPFYVQSTPSPVQDSHQQGIAEAPGSLGTVFTEVDSKPVTQAALDETKPFYMQPASSPAQQVQQPPQQGFAEVEGDSKHIPLPLVDEKHLFFPKRGVTPVQEQDYWHHGQQGVTEIEGSAGKAFTEIASKPGTLDAPRAHVAYFGQMTLSDPGQQVQQSPQQGVAQVDGGFSRVSTEVESKPGVQADFHASNPFYGRMTSAGFGQVGAESITHQNVPKHRGPYMQMVTVPKEQLEQLEQFWQSHQQSHQQSQQQGTTQEAANPVGKVFTKADDVKPASSFTPTITTPAQEFQQQGVNEDKVYTKADSRPVNPTSELNGSRVEAVSVSGQQVVAEADGTAFSEADSKPVNPTS